MKNFKIKHFWAIILVVAVLVSVVPINGIGQVVAIADSGYYSSINAVGGNALLGQLHDLITSTHKRYSTYNDCKTESIIYKTDGGRGNNIIEFYSQAEISSDWGSGKQGTWNREHVWCQNLSAGLWGETGGGADLLHIRPVESGLNSARGNSKFGMVDGGRQLFYEDSHDEKVALGGYTAASVFEPIDASKGDVARILMYVYTHYNKAENVYGSTNGNGSSSYFGTLKFTNVVSAATEAQAIALLLAWNKLDPVDDVEIARNNFCQEYQGNRNPFVDHPEYADAIWSEQAVDVDLESITVTPQTVELSVGQGKQLAVKPQPIEADGRVTWDSSDTSVAFVSSTGMISARAEGTATITATSVANKSITATVTVVVKKQASSSGNKVVVINQASFDLTEGYNFKDWSEGELGGFAYIYGGSSAYPVGPNMQFNVTQKSYYFASNLPAEGGIKSVTVNIGEGSERPWKLLTSKEPFTQVDKKPTEGTDWGTQVVTAEGTTWVLSGCTDKYFALTYETDKGACYLSSIIVEYGGDSGSTSSEGYQSFVDAVNSLSENISLDKQFGELKNAIDLYNGLDSTSKQVVAVQEAYAKLQSAVSSYNSTINSVNKKNEIAISNAGSAGNSIWSLIESIIAKILKNA